MQLYDYKNSMKIDTKNEYSPVFSLFFHFGKSFCDVKTHEIIEVAIVDLFFFDNYSHFTGVAASFEVYKNDDSV